MIAAPEAERAVIGSFLVEKEAISSCIDLIQPEHFNEAQNVAIVRCIYDLFKSNRPADIVSVVEAGKAAGLEFPSLGAYLGQCIESVTTAAHVTHHARTVLDRHYKRQLIQAAGKLADSAMQEDGVNESLAAIQKLALEADAIYAPPVYTYKNGLHDFLESVGIKSGKSLYRTGFPSLDAATYGMGVGEIITIGAATNVGKSIFCLNLMNNIAGRGVKCLYFGSEMDSHEVTQRHVSIVSGVEAFKLRIGRLDLEDGARIHAAIADKLYKMPVSIFDHPSPSLNDVNSAIISTGAKIVFIDYLGRMSLPKAENHRLRIQEFMVQLKSLARKREVVIFLAAQLGRQAYAQMEAPPTLADLSESKAIEQESDKVLLLWSPKAKNSSGNQDETLEVIVAKNRQGKKNTTFDLIRDCKTLALREKNHETLPN